MFFEHRCAVCGADGARVCSSCESTLQPAPVEPGAADRSVYVLDPVAREIVAALKYRRERRLAVWFARRLAPLVPRNAEVITWCPATPCRVRRRGFDQGRELAAATSGLVGVPSKRLLRRARGDDRQTGRTREERLVGPRLELVGRCAGLVVLVDDVTTTGATVATARRILLEAGAVRVVAVTLAATPQHTS